MDPSEGYEEARRLLEKEYGDPFKESLPTRPIVISIV